LRLVPVLDFMEYVLGKNKIRKRRQWRERWRVYDLQTLSMKIPDPRYVIKTAVEIIFNLGVGKKKIPPRSPVWGD